ncbi:MAG TPA: M20/M25/M40 family metallo-hydrolase [Silvibacterium sp.]|nr:M20/M25/M40 family metallo-hydrolase [Silvibacterium sp.]
MDNRIRLFARLRVFICAVAVLLMALSAAPAGAVSSSDVPSRDLDATGSAIPRSPVDPRIERALSRISAAQIQHTIETLVSFRTRNTLSSMETDLPKGQGITAAADWIESELNRYSAACGGCLEVKRDTFTQAAETGPDGRIPRATTLTNVYAVLRGTDPAQSNRVLLVTGHYDSRNTDVMDDHGFAPGANDDASGVAVSLECARVLSRLKFPATLVFAAVAGEEQGLYGSAHLAKLAKSEGWQVEGVLNNDIVGGNTTPGDRLQDKSVVRVFSEGIPATATPEEVRRLRMLGYDSDSPSRELARAVADVARTYDAGPSSAAIHPILEFRLDRFLRGGDHYSFNKQGFAGVRFTEWREDFNHQHQNVRTENGVEYGDLLKFVDFHYVARVAGINAATMATLAAAPPPPNDVQVVVSNLDNNSELRWKAGPGASPDTRYEVVWRELAAPDWQRFTNRGIHLPGDAGGLYAVTLPISKDNVIFGVRAVDAAGHASLAVVPMPVR